ncbi:MAG: hypothetical protein ACP5SB_00600 [Caldisericaceae bacterium]
MENKLAFIEYTVKASDYDHLGDATLASRKSIEEIIRTYECYRDFKEKKDYLRCFGICAYEAESNIIIHSHFGILKTTVLCEKLKTVAIDIGPGIESLLLALTPGYSTASKQARELGFGAGMGLKNIQKVADFSLISSVKGKGTYVFFEIWKEVVRDPRRIQMKVKEIIEKLKLKVLTENTDAYLEQEVLSAYASDLLSNVLAKGKEESAWLTVQTNLNIIGVAVIKRIPIIIVTEDNNVPYDTIKKAQENSIIIARASSDTFETSGKLYEFLNSK